MNNLGIHQISFQEYYSSYFVPRNYGNYLFFSELFKGGHDAFFKSKGGLYKQFVASSDPSTSAMQELFVKFGCSAVSLKSEERFELKLRWERWPDDFYDDQVEFFWFDPFCAIGCRQAQKRIIFLGPQTFFDRGSIKTLLKSEQEAFFKIFETIKKLQPDWLFFSFHRGKNHLAPLKEDWPLP